MQTRTKTHHIHLVKVSKIIRPDLKYEFVTLWTGEHLCIPLDKVQKGM